jgi:hypothetical protein
MAPASDASVTTTSTAIGKSQRETAAIDDTTMGAPPPPNDLEAITRGDSTASTTAPTAPASDASVTTTSTAIGKSRRETAAIDDTAMALPPPNDLEAITRGDSTASTTAPTAPASDAGVTTTSTAIGKSRREIAAIDDTAMAPPPPNN